MARSVVASLVISLLLVAAIAPASMLAQAPEVGVTPTATTAIDELQSGFSPWGPGWRDGSSGYAGHHYWARASQKKSLVGVWAATLGQAGRYRVLAFIPPGHASSRAAVYRVLTADGWVLRVGNQWQRRGKWLSLGIHELSARAEVRLTDETRDPRGTRRELAFDALQFVALDVPTPQRRPPRRPPRRHPSPLPRRSSPARPPVFPRPPAMPPRRSPGRRPPPTAAAPSAATRSRPTSAPPPSPRRTSARGHEPDRQGPHQRHDLHLPRGGHQRRGPRSRLGPLERGHPGHGPRRAHRCFRDRRQCLRAGHLDGARLERRQPAHRLHGHALHRRHRPDPRRTSARRPRASPSAASPTARPTPSAWWPSTPWAPVPPRTPRTRSPRPRSPARPPVFPRPPAMPPRRSPGRRPPRTAAARSPATGSRPTSAPRPRRRGPSARRPRA